MAGQGEHVPSQEASQPVSLFQPVTGVAAFVLKGCDDRFEPTAQTQPFTLKPLDPKSGRTLERLCCSESGMKGAEYRWLSVKTIAQELDAQERTTDFLTKV